MTAMLALASMGGIVAAQSSSNAVSISASDPPSVPQDGTFSVTYTVENNASAATAYTIKIPNLPENTTVTDITGDVRSSTPGGSPPAASTDSVAVGESATITAVYKTTGVTTDTLSVEATATAPLSRATDKATSTISVKQPGPNITVTDAPSLVTQGNGMSIDYSVAANDAAVTLTLTEPQSNINISKFDGGIQSSNLNGSQPSASTEFISANSSEPITVDYTVSSTVFDTEPNITQQITLTASNPTVGASDTATASVTIQKPSEVPSDPTTRAEEIAGVESTDNVTQDDVTVTITKFSRDSAANGIDVTQNDVTAMITYFARNN
jgi:hypothetical protein